LLCIYTVFSHIWVLSSNYYHSIDDEKETKRMSSPF
jgi:hypothetical protein